MATELAGSLSALHISGPSDGLVDSSEGHMHHDLKSRIRTLSRVISDLLDRLYDIQELRHANNDQQRLDSMLHDLDKSICTLPRRLQEISLDATNDTETKTDIDILHDDYRELTAQHSSLMFDMKEDGWVTRFNSTADQAEGMIKPLESTLMECLRYIESITTSPVPVPFTSDLPELPSISKLQDLVSRHQALRKAYAPSIAKILRVMEKSITERPGKDGAVLRRYDELSSQWTDLQKHLDQLDVRIQLEYTRHGLCPPNGLANDLPSTSSAPSYFTPAKVSTRHRDSVSSGTTQSSSRTQGLPVTPAMTRKSSFVSNASSARADQMPSISRTPVNQRIPSLPRATASPSLVTPSRIPVSTPIPRLSLSRSQTDTDSMEVLQTPERPRPTTYNSMTLPRASLTPSLPRTSTGLRSRGPPSSFQSFTPTPSGRPSSRMSMASCAPSAVAPVNLQPFQPSKYDLLDTHVQATIDQVGFDLFVARIDQPMKRGQRRRDDEEWKGEFVFGAGQRTSGVKLLKLAGKASADAPRFKVLVRVQGAWHDLATILQKRKDDARNL